MNEADEDSEVNENQPVQPPADSLASQSRIHIETEWQGPLPPPHSLALYDQIVPNGAERLMAMAERGHQHQIDQEATQMELEKEALQSVNMAIANDAVLSKLGLIFGFSIALAGMVIGTWLMSTGHGVVGLTSFFGPLVGLATAFVYTTKARRSRPQPILNEQKEVPH